MEKTHILGYEIAGGARYVTGGLDTLEGIQRRVEAQVALAAAAGDAPGAGVQWRAVHVDELAAWLKGEGDGAL